LSNTKPMHKSILSGVVDHSPTFLKHLEKTGLLLGKLLEVLEINEYDGSILVSINSATGIYLSRDVAKNILVKGIK
jgi:DtxR family Mn-dependent transcriptional regulator